MAESSLTRIRKASNSTIVHSSGGSPIETYQGHQVDPDIDNHFLAIDLSQDFQNQTLAFKSTTKPKNAPNLRLGEMWVDEANKVIYTGFTGTPSSFGNRAPQNAGLWSFTPDGTGGGTWTNLNNTANSAFTKNVRPFQGLAASGNGKGYYLGGLCALR